MPANCQHDLERRVCGIKPEEHDDYDDTYETKASCEDDYQKDACSGIGLSMRRIGTEEIRNGCCMKKE